MSRARPTMAGLCAMLCLRCATPTTQGAPAPAGAKAASPESRPADRPEVVDAGGDWNVVVEPGLPLARGADDVVITGVAEVPADSRMQAAWLLAEAVARSELAKAVAVGVTELAIEVQNEGGTLQADRLGSEVTSLMLPGLPPASHAWAKLRRGETTVLLLGARYVMPLADLERALGAALRSAAGGPELARRLAARLGARSASATKQSR
jgi:hypothetical protein